MGVRVTQAEDGAYWFPLNSRVSYTPLRMKRKRGPAKGRVYYREVYTPL